MKVSRPYKDRPWLVLKRSNWLEDILGMGWWSMEVDTSHPEWTEKVLMPAIKKHENNKRS